MVRGPYQIIQDPVHGYRRLDPIPVDDEIGRFYQSHYYDMIRKGGRVPELRRLMAGGEEGQREREWLRSGLYTDIASVLHQYAPGKRVLDVGCGTGTFLCSMKDYGFETVGIEPSEDAVAIAESQGLAVSNSSLEEFIKFNPPGVSRGFDAITLLNVLEHVPNPVHVIEMTKMLLNPQGVVCIRVPNDFSEIQAAAQQQVKKDAWWIAVPDHINYFNFQSLHSFLTHLGFEIAYSQGDFPMELFLLMGDDYVGNPVVGNMCHQKRVNFDMAIPGELRRRMYRGLAEVGIGRDCLVFGKRT